MRINVSTFENEVQPRERQIAQFSWKVTSRPSYPRSKRKFFWLWLPFRDTGCAPAVKTVFKWSTRMHTCKIYCFLGDVNLLFPCHISKQYRSANSAVNCRLWGNLFCWAYCCTYRPWSSFSSVSTGAVTLKIRYYYLCNVPSPLFDFLLPICLQLI